MTMTAEPITLLSSLLDAAYCACGNRGECDCFDKRVST
mgnify:CR=1 FL=1